jgi:hypothetical protein
MYHTRTSERGLACVRQRLSAKLCGSLEALLRARYMSKYPRDEVEEFCGGGL